MAGALSRFADAYRGLCAATYDALVPADAVGDVAFFRKELTDGGLPALEVGCGTGRLLLQYRAEGLEVEGVDVSAEMLQACREKAAAAGIDVALHRGAMQALDIGRRYRCVYIPYYTFQLLTADDEIRAALACFGDHLQPEGKLLVPLFFPFENDVGREPAPDGEWSLRRQATTPGGDRIECWEHASYDRGAQIKHAMLRFDVRGADGALRETEEASLGIRWYTQEQFHRRLAEAGFDDVHVLQGHSFEPAAPDASSFTFVARRRGA